MAQFLQRSPWSTVNTTNDTISPSTAPTAVSLTSTRIPQPAHQQLTTREHIQLRQMQLAVPTTVSMPNGAVSMSLMSGGLHGNTSQQVAAAAPAYLSSCVRSDASSTFSHAIPQNNCRKTKSDLTSYGQHSTDGISSVVAASTATTADSNVNSFKTRSIGEIVENTVKLCYARDNGRRQQAAMQNSTVAASVSRLSVSTPSNSTCSPTGSLASLQSDGTSTPAAVSAASPTPSSGSNCEQLSVLPSSTTINVMSTAAAVTSEPRLPSKKAWLAKHLAESSLTSVDCTKSDSALDMSMASSTVSQYVDSKDDAVSAFVIKVTF